MKIGLASSVVSMFVMTSLSGSADGQLQVDPKQIEFAVHQVGPAPLPYQAVEVRLTVRNISKVRHGPPVVPVENSISQMPGVKGPGETEFRWPKACILTDKHWDRPHSTQIVPWKSKAALFLDPGEQTSVSLAFAADWMSKEGRWMPEQGRVIFERAGSYQLQLPYRSMSKVVEVVVPEPKGDDLVFFRLLDKDLRLASYLMSPIIVPDWEVRVNRETMAQIKELIERYPKSSYTDYARFALARYYSYHYPVKGKTPEEESLEGAKAAVNLLEPVVAKSFPYRAYCLVWLSSAYATAGQTEKAKKAWETALREHADALVIIEHFASEMPRELVEKLHLRVKAILTAPNVQELVKDPKIAKELSDILSDEDHKNALFAKEWLAFRKRVPKKD